MRLRAGWIWQASMSSAWILSSQSRSCELIWFYGKTSDWRWLTTEFDEVSDRLPARLQRQSRAAWLLSSRIRVFRSADIGICGTIPTEIALSDPTSSFFILMSRCLLSSSQIQSAAVHPFSVPPSAQSPRHPQDNPFRRTLPRLSLSSLPNILDVRHPPFRGRTERPPCSQRPRSGRGWCWVASSSLHACDREHEP